jgi:hypothetical protein
LQIQRSGKRWKFRSFREVMMMVGDDHIHVKEQDYDTDMDDGECIEFITVDLTLKTVREFLDKDKDWKTKIGKADPFFLGSVARGNMLSFDHFLEQGKG